MPEQVEKREEQEGNGKAAESETSQQAYSSFHTEIYSDRSQGRSGGGLFIQDLDTRKEVDSHRDDRITTTDACIPSEGGCGIKDDEIKVPTTLREGGSDVKDPSCPPAITKAIGECGTEIKWPPTTRNEGGLDEKPTSHRGESGVDCIPWSDSVTKMVGEGGTQTRPHPPTTLREGGLDHKPPRKS